MSKKLGKKLLPDNKPLDAFEIIGVICWMGLLLVLGLDLIGWLQ